MKKFFISALACCLLSVVSFAKNEVTTIGQVVETVDITADVDYTITGETPFDAMGSVNIVNLDHAVVIINKVRPSKVISKWMSHIYINGAKAVNGTNCQVKMYDRGAIILPYAKDFSPLTCYTGKDQTGESCNTYAIGNDGGFMLTLKDETLNNKIRSFVLKRGYMVTFATGTGGWGYSRCFIAADEDLTMNMPNVLDGKASSYRLFQWYDASKAGSNETSSDGIDKLNLTSCFGWGVGDGSHIPDCEMIPHHIYENYPTAAACGGATWSCHMKTNNEPGNSSDDHPQTVSEVLVNWQTLMRTGLRLCSESSHDGSMSHLMNFIDSIDDRGWRCDILDLHCYWSSGTFNNLTWYSDHYGNGRPIWISEWVWGSSWGKNGFWGATSTPGECSEANQTILYNGTKPILEVLNSNDRVERYFYWNSEAAGSHIYDGGKLTKLGEYYSTMETGLAFKGNSALQYVPKVVVTEPGELKATLNEADGLKTVRLSWTDPNGDMIDSMVVQYKEPGSYRWVTIKKVALKDVSSKSGASYGVTDTLQCEATGVYSKFGLHTYRVASYSADKFKGTTSTVAYSNQVTCTLAGALSVGDLQYGRIEYDSYAKKKANISKCNDPVVIVSVPSGVGAMTSNYGAGGQLTDVPASSSMGGTAFQWQAVSWYGDAAKTITETAGKEHTDFIVLPHGNYQIGDDFFFETGDSISYGMKDTEVEVTFRKPWPEGETPIVICELVGSAAYGSAVNVYDITNTGFKVTFTRQAYLTRFSTVKFNYIAVSQGQRDLGTGLSIKSGIFTDANGNEITNRQNRKGGSVNMYYGGSDLTFTDPYAVVGAQTNNFNVCGEMTRPGIFSGNYLTMVRSFDLTASTQPSLTDIKDETISNKLGYIVISSDGDAEAYPNPTIVNSDTPKTVVRGDANNDKEVTMADVMFIINYILGVSDPTFNFDGADANLDKQITNSDVMYVVNYLLNGYFPAENANVAAFEKHFIEKYVNQ